MNPPTIDPWRPDPDSRPDVWREHGALLALMGAYIAAGFVVDWSGLVPGMMSRMKFVQGYLITPLVAIAAVPFAVLLSFGRTLRRAEHSLGPLTWSDWAKAWRKCRTELFNRQRLAAVAVVTVGFPVFLTAFGSWKAAIPELHPFTWDPALRELDLAVHLGHDPWLLLKPLLGRPGLTDAVDFGYGWWILLIPVGLSWQAWSTRWALRRTFLLSFALVWVLLGTLAAIAFASVGPCFYGPLTGDGQAYAQVLDYLRGVHATHRLYAVETQDLLWKVYEVGSVNPFLRISAMPSVHVAIAALCAVVGWATSRVLGIVLTAYAVLVLLGSVHLAWHYAVDGYASLLALGPIWWLGARLGTWPASRDHRRPGWEPDRSHP